MVFYEILAKGIPTGMGSTDKQEAQAMAADYQAIYGERTTIMEIDDD